jgi:RimJ/RimL family protein N-acetyltransferase
MTGIAREARATEHHRASIWGVYVVPEARGHHLGDRLLAAAIAWARSLDGVLQVHLGVNSANLAAVRAYERAGFRLTGRTPRARIVDGKAIDHDWMVLMLD